MLTRSSCLASRSAAQPYKRESGVTDVNPVYEKRPSNSLHKYGGERAPKRYEATAGGNVVLTFSAIGGGTRRRHRFQEGTRCVAVCVGRMLGIPEAARCYLRLTAVGETVTVLVLVDSGGLDTLFSCGSIGKEEEYSTGKKGEEKRSTYSQRQAMSMILMDHAGGCSGAGRTRLFMQPSARAKPHRSSLEGSLCARALRLVRKHV